MSGIGSIQYASVQYAQPQRGSFSRYKFFQEILQIQDTASFKTSKLFSDILQISDLMSYLKSAFATFVDNISLEELPFRVSVKKAFTETLNIVDSVVSLITGYLFVDAISIAENYSSKTSKAFRDALTFTECMLRKLDGFYVLWKKRLYETALAYAKRARPTLTEYAKRDNVTAVWAKKVRPTDTTFAKKTFATSVWEKKDRPKRCETE